VAKEDELALFKKWKRSQNKEQFQELYESMRPLIYRASQKAAYGSNIPESAHGIYAAQNFYDALRTYDPTKGAALGTHVHNTVEQKGKRLNYLYQNLGHMPEPRAQSVGLYQNEYGNLRATLGREPSAAELSDRLGWSLTQVKNIRKEIQKDLSLSEGLEEQSFFESSKDEELLNYLYYDLTSEEKVVYEHVFGKNGKPRLMKANGRVNFPQIARKMGVSESKARSLFNKIRTKLEKAAR